MRRPARIHLSPPHMSPHERRFDSNWIAPLGPQVDAFEAELSERVEGRHVAALSSGTAGLHLAMELLGVGPGDEVLVSTLTFSASVNPIRYQGATPVFIDSELKSWNLDPALLEEELDRRAKVGRLPKAVLAVDLYGQCADYEAIVAACRKYDVPLVEDAAEALGGTYQGRPAGVFGDLAIFSFNGNKIITTSGGGALVSDREEWIEKARFLATQARDPAPHYQHSHIGYNYRLINLLAGVGRGQFRVLEERVDARRANNAFFRERLGGLPGLTVMPEAPGCRSTFWLPCIQIDPEAFGATREDLRLALEDANIESRPVWKPMHLQPIFAEHPVVGGRVAEGLFENGLCLPSGSSMTAEDRERVVEVVLRVAGR